MGEWGKKHRAMRHYDRTAASYDTQYAEEQGAKIEAALSSIALKKNDLVLDMGCGTGLLFSHIADKTKLIVGMDISAKLLEQASRRAKQSTNITLVQADADHTPFKGKTFHNVFAITLLQNMPNPTSTLREIERIAKPEGITVLTTLKKKFTQKAITDLLRKTGLRPGILETTPEIKDHIVHAKTQF